MRCSRTSYVRRKVLQKANCGPVIFRLTRKGVYTPEARALARILVKSGCAEAHVGMCIQRAGKLFGITIKKNMDRRTVHRAIIEGGIAAKIQLGYEMSQAKSLTISADSTSHRHQNYESSHIALRVPDYKKGSIQATASSTPKLRLVGVHATVDHTSETSKNGWLERISDCSSRLNSSPLAVRLVVSFTLVVFAYILMGMNGDHASSEKSCSNLIHEWKTETILVDRGQKALAKKNPSDLAIYLGEWNKKKIRDAGGPDTWNAMSGAEQARRDIILLGQLALCLGIEAHSMLSAAEKRIVNLFIWAGCCMHKDQNSFGGGNTALIASYPHHPDIPLPFLLANKHNAATLHKALEPGKALPGSAELEAFEASTRGGVKIAAIAGAILRNRDDKKGQGDTYSIHFPGRRFSDTNNTHFGSHGEAAADILVNRLPLVEFLRVVRDKKKAKAAWTNIEWNLFNALQDIPTITELAILVLYSQNITHPYMRSVRGSDNGSKNVLDLGPLHVEVRDHIHDVIEDTDLWLSPTTTFKAAALDGLEWERVDAVETVQTLLPRMPHIAVLLVEFLRGSLITWERFSAEFALGGLIDQTSASEKELVWMPSTNDANEGALRSFRIQIWAKPSMTLHRYNSLAMFNHNDTQDFMDVMFTPEDHEHVLRTARELDGSGLAVKFRQEQLEFDLQTVAIRRAREAERVRKVIETQERLSKVTRVMSDAEILPMTVKLLTDQLDLFRQTDKEVPVNSRIKLKAEKQAALKDALKHYQDHPATILDISEVVQDEIVIMNDWHEEEDSEMED
ncbi:hypothetical protein Hypma_003276 [Hypsizygus marmoreus]|uniref:Uncharacterized protein n=1 Tax=Hypsizygus marmoreus TaxID=39966 RepID=A0A369K2H0_HYPMA|nr:hypothetical protein Hypma_003276 [Hypsizygus marmoreus]